MDEDVFLMCKFQARLFELSVTKIKVSSPLFVKYFMKSPVTRRMDSTAFLSEATDCERIISDMNAKYSTRTGGRRYSEEAMYWMGYIYRYMCLSKKITSSKAYMLIKPDELIGLYFPYHSLDPEAAVSRIFEAKTFNPETAALEALKRVYKIK